MKNWFFKKNKKIKQEQNNKKQLDSNINSNNLLQIDITPELSVYADAKNYAYETATAIAEFIDNSIASFRKNNTFFENNKIKKYITLIFNENKNELFIIDNAYGISCSDLPRALKLAAVPTDRSGLNEFGMGLKKGAFWFGRKLTILTKNPNNNGYKMIFDLDNLDKNIKTVNAEINDDYKTKWGLNHGTIIYIEKIYKERDISFRNIFNKLVKRISSSYRRDIINNKINISILAFFKKEIKGFYDVVATKSLIDKKYFCENFQKENIFNGEPLKYEEPKKLIVQLGDYNAEFGVTTCGYEATVNYEIDLNNQKYNAKGIFFIRDEGSRSEAGIDLFRRGRIVKEKCKDFFSDSGSFEYQRINGFFDLDNFPISQTKDEIAWEGKLFDTLKNKFDNDPKIKQLIKISRKIRFNKKNNDSDIQKTNKEYIESISNNENIITISSSEIKQEVAASNNFEYKESDILHNITLVTGKNLKIYSRVLSNKNSENMVSWLEIKKGTYNNEEIKIVEIDSNKTFFMPFTFVEGKREQFITILRKFSVYWAIAEEETKGCSPEFDFEKFRRRLNLLININENSNFIKNNEEK